jgi:Ser/Thr protein kinase RdoA (MazF antagonist)
VTPITKRDTIPAGGGSAGPSGAPAPQVLAHGMGKALVEPDWPPLTGAELGPVLGRYELGPGAGPGPAHGHDPAPGAEVLWHSPRPMSAAALVRAGGRVVFVKRHHIRVRTAAQLAAEHAFADHLAGHGVRVPPVLATRTGATTVRAGDYVYEVHAPAPGLDLYRDAPSWTPFTGTGHAWAAGAALARLHRAARGFRRPQRPFGVLIGSCAVVTAPDPLAAVARLLRRRPGLAAALAHRPWRDDIARHHLPAIARAAPLLRAQGRQWAHEDWHPSNLTWDTPSPGGGVAAVIDLGLANRTSAAHDLAVAIERSCVAWLDLAESGHAEADMPAVDALFDGYQEASPLTGAQIAAVAGVLPVAHLEYALSETEYFAGIAASRANADLAYDGYLIGHARWFTGREGRALLGHLRRRAARQPAAR